MAAVRQTWDGEAAASAETFFATQADVLDTAAQYLKDTAPEFDAVVRGMKSSANLASGFFSTVLDASLIAWGCYAAGAATSWTIVGGIVGAVCGTGAVGVATYALVELFNVCQDLFMILDALTSLIGVAVSWFINDSTLPVVSAYDNAQV